MNTQLSNAARILAYNRGQLRKGSEGRVDSIGSLGDTVDISLASSSVDGALHGTMLPGVSSDIAFPFALRTHTPSCMPMGV